MGFLSLIGWLTAFMSDASIALVEDGTLPGSSRSDMGNSGQHACILGWPEASEVLRKSGNMSLPITNPNTMEPCIEPG